ncbi:probable rhamnogalacturonate lyase C isoform X2 [Gastrolobium bilobum]|uniref:probable rhamnogalacturonate lyase C isoform X2 n=1 Tax=Gastrolobium bilobum TaxID=150636 RepID=UPI002AAF6E27|nr:probable rhamnogalacturonate lyase C isoform X2 [Gastrolobium bilobum]
MKMKVMGKKSKRVFFLWWFGMTVQLCFLLGACSEKTSFRRGLREINSLEPTPSFSEVKLNTENHQQLVVDNGIVTVILSRPEGYVLGISYNGIDNILEAENEEQDRGYLDVVWNEPGKSSNFQRIHGTNFSVIAADGNLVEVSFLRTWTYSMSGSNVPINIDIRYIFRSGDSGFYSYAIFDRPEGFPAVQVDQIRIVFKLKKDRFNYMAVSDNKQRSMPTMRDRETGQILAYPEAVLLTRPINPEFRGEVDDKYQYSCENTDNTVHGWISLDPDAPVGFWMITPSNEFRNAGPIKQDLTSHVGPFTLSMFVSTHYAGKEVTMAFQEGETYKKVFGPVFVYVNSASSNEDSLSLWSDAVQQLSKEVKSWPYDFPRSEDYLPPNQRGTVFGRLLVQDWYIREGRFQYANNAYIGLALPGDAGSWQKESKGYQFWTRADTKGYFVIKNIVPGDYNLYAWVPGFIGDYRYNATITITPGRVIKLDSLVYSPPRSGPTLWEIGIPDRSAAEFYVPDPYPTLMNKLYNEQRRDKYRQYGLWERYADLYPNDDLVYTIGVNKYNKDWFFAHVTRNLGNKTYQPTTWQIIFDNPTDILGGNYTLQLALACAADANLQVRFNDPSAYPPHFATGSIGGDNAIARHGIHGLHWLFSIDVPGERFVKGKNTIYLRQSRAINPFQGVMYDYIRLEQPPAPTT